MKALIISAYDQANGSARAAYRLHQGLQRINLDSNMLVKGKSSSDSLVIAPQSNLSKGLAEARVTFDALPLKLYRQRETALMSLQWLPDNIASKVRKVNPDIVNLHWANDAFLKIETLAKFKKPIVWSLHDMWAFTGGCHYTQECDRYLQACGACPSLGSKKEWDLSRWVWNRKRKAWKNLNLTVVGLSSWLADCARASSLFQGVRVEVIHNGIDTQVYKPTNKQIARQLLGLPQDKKLILFGALQGTSGKRKGFHLLQATLNELSQSRWNTTLELVVLGSSRPSETAEFGLKTHYLGKFSDDLSLVLSYSAVDAFIAPSLQENLANTVMESLACGTPCIAFDIGGMPDMIEHQINGYLAQPYKTEDLAQGIVWVVEHQERYQNLSIQARRKIEKEFTLEIQAENYKTLFNQLATNSHKARVLA